jgi:outer membrane protein OmpA-like peptidoglycan-associated protein
MTQPRHLLVLLAGLLGSTLACAATVSTTSLGEPVERQLSDAQTFRQWVQDPELLKVEHGDRIEVQQVAGEELETVKLRNFIPPIRFESGVAQIPQSYVDKLGEVLEGLRGRSNVRVHFVGHADSQPLSDTLARVFEDNAGLSRERAGEVAEHFKNALNLPPDAIAYDWAGDTRRSHRTQLRRVARSTGASRSRCGTTSRARTVREQEVVVAEDIKRVKVCRMETVCKLRYQEGHARRARVRNLVVPLRYEDESTTVSPEFTQQVRRRSRTCTRSSISSSLHRLQRRRAPERPQRAHLRRPSRAFQGAGPPGGAGDPGSVAPAHRRPWKAMDAGPRIRSRPMTRRRAERSIAASKSSSGTTIRSSNCPTSRRSARESESRRSSRRSTTRRGGAWRRSSCSRASLSFRRATWATCVGHSMTSQGAPTRGCGSSATRATKRSIVAPRRSTATTSACRRPGHAGPWIRSSRIQRLPPRTPNTKDAATCSPTTS